MEKLIKMYSVTVKESRGRSTDAAVEIDLNKAPVKSMGPMVRVVIKGEVLMTVKEFVAKLGKKVTSEDIVEIQEMSRDVDEGGVHTYYATGWEITMWVAK